MLLDARADALVMCKVTGIDLERSLHQLAGVRTNFFGVNSVFDNVPRQRALLESAGVRAFRVSCERTGGFDPVGLVGVRTCAANEQLATLEMLCLPGTAEPAAVLAFAVDLLASATGVRCFLLPVRDEGWARDIRSIGFVPLGVLRAHEYADGGYHDVSLFAYEVNGHVAP